MKTKNKEYKGLKLGPNVDLEDLKKNDLRDSIDDLTEEDFADKTAKVRISMWIDKTLLQLIKAEATKGNKKYQTMIQDVLKESFLNEKPIDKRLVEIENRLKKLEGRSA